MRVVAFIAAAACLVTAGGAVGGLRAPPTRFSVVVTPASVAVGEPVDVTVRATLVSRLDVFVFVVPTASPCPPRSLGALNIRSQEIRESRLAPNRAVTSAVFYPVQAVPHRICAYLGGPGPDAEEWLAESKPLLVREPAAFARSAALTALLRRMTGWGSRLGPVRCSRSIRA